MYHHRKIKYRFFKLKIIVRVVRVKDLGLGLGRLFSLMEGPSKNKVNDKNKGDPLEGRYLPADAPSAVFRSQMALQEAQMTCLAHFGELVKCRECGSNNDLHGKDKSLYNENSELILYCDNSACELTGTMPSLGRAWKNSLERGYEDLESKPRLLWDQLSHVDALQREYNLAIEVMTATEESRKGPSPSSLALAVSNLNTNNLQVDGFKNVTLIQQWGDMEVDNAYFNNKKRDRPASTPDPSPVMRKVAPPFRESSPTSEKSPSRTLVGTSQSPSSGYRNPFKKADIPAMPLHDKSIPAKSPPLPAAPANATTSLKAPTLMGPPATPQSKPQQSEVDALRAENSLLKQEMAILRDQMTALQRTMDQLVAQDVSATKSRGDTTRDRGSRSYRGGWRGRRTVTRYTQSGKEETFDINEDSDSDESFHYSYPEDFPEAERLQRGPNYEAKKKAKEQEAAAGLGLGLDNNPMKEKDKGATTQSYATAAAKAPRKTEAELKQQRARAKERNVAMSFFQEKAPQEWKSTTIRWYPGRQYKDHRVLNSLAWRAMEKMKIRSAVKDLCLIGKQIIRIYYCEATATKVEAAILAAKLSVATDLKSNPSFDSKADIKASTINRVSYLLAKHNSISRLCTLITQEVPAEWMEECREKANQRAATNNARHQ